jgi:hypothetical protein
MAWNLNVSLDRLRILGKDNLRTQISALTVLSLENAYSVMPITYIEMNIFYLPTNIYFTFILNNMKF